MLERAEEEIAAGRRGGDGWMDKKPSDLKYHTDGYKAWLTEYFFPRFVREPATKWKLKQHNKFLRKRYPDGYPHARPYAANKPAESLLQRRRKRALKSRKRGQY